MRWAMCWRLLLPLVVLAAQLGGPRAEAQTFHDVNPDFSDSDPSDPDGASGGRVNRLAVEPSNDLVMYAASEWGGLFKTLDGGLTWFRLDGHVPVVTWGVAIDPSSPNRVYATSQFDGKAASLAGINISLDSGATWAKPASATPPDGFCQVADDRSEPKAFGIAIDPGDNDKVYVGTGCGLAISEDAGVSWSFVDPTEPPGTATRIWDVLAHGGGVLDICGDDGHLRSTDGGATWIGGSGLASGRCSLAVSPDEPYVLLAVVGTTIYETTDAGAPGGATWTPTRTNPSPQGRIPFVVTNQRSDDGGTDVFDLWFGDVSLYRAGCVTPDPPAPGGAPRCGTGNSPAWAGGFTRAAGGHDDMGFILFDPTAANDRCPILMSSDGGVYYNTDRGVDCQRPNWEQPNVTPHALWMWTLSGADQDGLEFEDLYFGNQDNGVFGTINAGAASPDWSNDICCDGFDTSADPEGVVYTICCFGGGRATRAFRKGPGFVGGSELDYPPTGLFPGFNFPDSIVQVAGRSYAAITRDCTQGAGGCQGADGGLYFTPDLDANPVQWTELGNSSEPPSQSLCGLQVSLDDQGIPTFYVQVGTCNTSNTQGRLFRYTGTNALGLWTELFLPDGGFGVVAVAPDDRNLLLASSQTTTGGGMYLSTDAGVSWTPLPQLDDLMTAGGTIAYRNLRGATSSTSFGGYWQPSLAAIGPRDSGLMLAGGKDSGIFLSENDGATWRLISDPFTPDTSGTPHLPRPWYAYFDSEDGEVVSVYIGTRGRGVWRIDLGGIFADGFESGDTSAWSSAQP